MSSDKTAGELTGEFVSELVADVVRGFMLMLGMGALHSLIFAVPHPGFWAAFLIIWGIQAVASATRKSG